jgi:hypothetical protein
MKSVAAASMAFIVGCVVSAAMWVFWTPRCNEGCPHGVALLMIMFVVAFPLACGAAGMLAARWPQTRWRWTLAVAILGTVSFAWLTHAASA